jgi:hypothetical protein
MSDKNFKVKNGLTIQGTVDTLVTADNAGGVSVAGPITATSFVGSGAGLTGISSYSAPTIGSTSVASGATVTTISALTLSNATLTGTLTAGGGVGTSGQVLASTGTGTQWVAAPAPTFHPVFAMP